MTKPSLLLLAGPNGAGKTTFARANFPELEEQGLFLNADEVARALTPLDPERSALAAGRVIVEKRQALLRKGASFVIETTLASQTLLGVVREARRRGYLTSLVYLFVPDPDLCVERVAQRVTLGGHFIPTASIQRRYQLSLRLLPTYVETVDLARVYRADASPQLLLEKTAAGTSIEDPETWSAILKASQQRR